MEDEKLIQMYSELYTKTMGLLSDKNKKSITTKKISDSLILMSDLLLRMKLDKLNILKDDVILCKFDSHGPSVDETIEKFRMLFTKNKNYLDCKGVLFMSDNIDIDKLTPKQIKKLRGNNVISD